MTTSQNLPLLFPLDHSLLTKALPVCQLSFEAQRERKAGLGQTLTGLGVYRDASR